MFDVKSQEPVQTNYDWFCAFDSLYGTTGLKTLSQSQFHSINFRTPCSFVPYTFAPRRGRIIRNRFLGSYMIFKRQIWRAMFGNVREP